MFQGSFKEKQHKRQKQNGKKETFYWEKLGEVRNTILKTKTKV